MIQENIASAIKERIQNADSRYGSFASSHEMLGVALEEWDELKAAVHGNLIIASKAEALDLAAVLIRFAQQIEFPRG